MKFAKIAVEAANYSFDAEFDYIIPPELEDTCLPGCRVTVPFGMGNKKTIGMVFGVTDKSEGKKLKEVIEVLDRKPLLGPEMLELARIISDRTFCTLFDAVRVMIPPGINHRMVRSYAVSPDADPEKAAALEGTAAEFYAYLKERGTYVKGDAVFKKLATVPDKAVPDMLVRKGLITERDEAVRNLGDMTSRMIRLLPEESEIKLTAKQKELVNVLRDVGTATVKELCYFTGCTPAVAKALVKNGAAEMFECEVDFFADMTDSEGERTPIELADEQQTAYEKLTSLALSGKSSVSLLYGVTGSGKTSVYMRVIDEVIDSGKNVLLLVPEIGLTPQTLSLFCSRYGKDVAVFHSALSVRERSEQWKRVKEGRARIAIGTRSAVFAPFENIGLIIIDEEQEHTYKSEQTPRYDAAEVAKYRAYFNNCLLVLASATPKVETYEKALKGKYELCTLTKRYGSAVMPKVVTVDMRTAEKMPGCSEISRELYESLKASCSTGRQSILLINRRGFNTFAVCDSCGQVITCPNCSISMTYHQANGRLLCHYCGYSVPVTGECPECHERAIRYAGFGTQKIEDELHLLFPDARILRMDADTTTAKDSHEKLLGAFSRGEYDIMIGTQMVAKGLDFPNVTLVGVVAIDQQLYNDDFRSLEKAFSLLTQVIGRSGRGESEGTAVIQTLTPENEIIRMASRQDYGEFFDSEIRIRRAMVYPPFCDLCVMGVMGKEELPVRTASGDIIMMLREMTQAEYKGEKIIVLGPVPARVAKLGGKYRYRIIIKCVNTGNFRKMISDILKKTATDPKYKKITVYADMNPDTMF